MEVSNEIIKWKQVIREEGAEALKGADSNLLKNSEFMLSMAKEDIDCLQYLDDDLQTKEFFLTIMEETKDKDPYADVLAYSKFDLDSEFFLDAISINYNVLRYANFTFVDNDNFMFKAAQIDVRALGYASYTLLNYPEFMLDMIEIEEKAVCYLGKTLQTTNFMLFAADKNPKCMKHAKRKFRGDPTVMGYAVKSDPDSLQFGTRKVRNTWEIVALGLEREEIRDIPYNERNCFRYAGRKIQNNPKDVESAIDLNPYAYRYASPKVQGLISIQEFTCIKYREIFGVTGLSDDKILNAIRNNAVLIPFDNGKKQKKPERHNFVPQVNIIQLPRQGTQPERGTQPEGHDGH